MSVLTREEKDFLEVLPKALYAIAESINRVAGALERGGSKPVRDVPRLKIDSFKRFKCAQNVEKEHKDGKNKEQGPSPKGQKCPEEKVPVCGKGG